MKRIILIMTIAGVVLAACGTKGPLYIPEKQYPLPKETQK